MDVKLCEAVKSDLTTETRSAFLFVIPSPRSLRVRNSYFFRNAWWEGFLSPANDAEVRNDTTKAPCLRVSVVNSLWRNSWS